MKNPKVEAAGKTILEAFETGNVPKALAQVFIQTGGRHADTWSWTNQLLTALAGHSDAMGFKGWLSVGRCVRKGQKAFTIFAPLPIRVKDKKAEDGKRTVTLFRAVSVFGIDQTEIIDADKWAKHNVGNESAESFRDSLPMLDVAKAWGLTVNVYNAKRTGALGWYRHGQAIAVGVENLATWAHELIHAADDKAGNLVERGQHWRSETVAELGGAILMLVCGYDTDADLGGAWEYIKKYATTAKIDPIKACMDVLKRTCEAVTMILEQAETVEQTETVETVAA